MQPTGDSLEHVYAGSRHVQNYDGTSTYGAVWNWAGASNDHGMPLRSPNPDTASKKAYNFAEINGMDRRSFDVSSTLEADKREFHAQGRPQAKDSSGSGANWYLGTQSAPQSLGQNTVESRFMFQGTVTATDMSRATDKREKDRMGVFGTSNSYAGSYGRVTSESIGRDLNPLGRGSGLAFVAGAANAGGIAPAFARSRAAKGTGNSINNPCGSGGGCGGGSGTGFKPATEDPGEGTIPPDPYTDPQYHTDRQERDCLARWESHHPNPGNCLACRCATAACIYHLCDREEWKKDPWGCQRQRCMAYRYCPGIGDCYEGCYKNQPGCWPTECPCDPKHYKVEPRPGEPADIPPEPTSDCSEAIKEFNRVRQICRYWIAATYPSFQNPHDCNYPDPFAHNTELFKECQAKCERMWAWEIIHHIPLIACLGCCIAMKLKFDNVLLECCFDEEF